MRKFLAGEWRTTPIPPVGKTLYIYNKYIYYTYYTYAHIKDLYQQVLYSLKKSVYITYIYHSGHLTSENLSTLCVTDMYGIYFHLSVQCS